MTDTVTYSNDFHATSHAANKRLGDMVTRRYVNDVDRALCGMSNCVCGGTGGVRGSTYGFEPVDSEGHVYRIVEEV